MEEQYRDCLLVALRGFCNSVRLKSVVPEASGSQHGRGTQYPFPVAESTVSRQSRPRTDERLAGVCTPRTRSGGRLGNSTRSRCRQRALPARLSLGGRSRLGRQRRKRLSGTKPVDRMPSFIRSPEESATDLGDRTGATESHRNSEPVKGTCHYCSRPIGATMFSAADLPSARNASHVPRQVSWVAVFRCPRSIPGLGALPSHEVRAPGFSRPPA